MSIFLLLMAVIAVYVVWRGIAPLRLPRAGTSVASLMALGFMLHYPVISRWWGSMASAEVPRPLLLVLMVGCIAVLLFAWVLVILAFFILAIQLFITLIEFKLATLAGFVLIPFGLFGKTAFMAERVLGLVISSGVKVLVLAVIIGIGSTLFSQFTQNSTGAQPTIDDAMALVLAALSLLGLGIFGPGVANGLVSGGPQLGAGTAVGAGVAAGGMVAAGAGLAVGSARLAGSAISGAVAASSGGSAGKGSGGGSFIGSDGDSTGGAATSGGGASVSNGPPSWAQRFRRSHSLSHGVSAAARAVRSAEHGASGASVDLSEGKN